MTTVVHVIAGLGIGGAERILVDVVRDHAADQYGRVDELIGGLTPKRGRLHESRWHLHAAHILA